MAVGGVDSSRFDRRTADGLLSTTRSVRKRLDLERPVERFVIEECLALAFQAPSGGNSQGWSWILVDDPAIKKHMADIYRGGMLDHRNRENVGDAPPPRGQKGVKESVTYLAEVLDQVPVLLVPTINHSYGRSTTFQQASTWGSILPAVWNFMLALRSRGMGSAWTTIHLYREQEMAELLGIPFPGMTQAGLFPIAYTVGTRFSPAERDLSSERVSWNRWTD